MTRGERENAIIGAARHYTRLAHHPGEASGTEHFARNEPRMALTRSATLMAYKFPLRARPRPLVLTSQCAANEDGHKNYAALVNLSRRKKFPRKKPVGGCIENLVCFRVLLRGDA
jgi:hypothetical protein